MYINSCIQLILSLIVFKLLDIRYFLAVDDSHSTLEEIVKAISVELGNGNIRNFTSEEALLIKDLDQLAYDSLLVCLSLLLKHN